MKKNKMIIRFMVLVMAFALILFSGCSFNVSDFVVDTPKDKEVEVINDKEDSNKECETETIVNTVVSYVSTDSKVYSTTAEVVKNVADSVVEISTETVVTSWGRQYISSGAGSGVIVGASDNTYYIITNNHVIEDANDITVATRDGVTYKATLVATDDSADIAVVKITSYEELSLAIIGNSDDLEIGEDLIAIGNPLGSLGGTVTKGILSATGRMIQIGNYSMTLLQTDTAINPGNSGGGLFNMKGELIGIVNAKTSDEEIEGICFAIPINIAKRVYDDLISYGYILGRATFNVEVAEGTISQKAMSSQTRTIVYVTSTNSDSSTGFKEYDMIYKINGVEITSLLDYNIALSKITAGEEVEIEVYRGSMSQSFWSSGISFENESTTFKTIAKQYGE